MKALLILAFLALGGCASRQNLLLSSQELKSYRALSTEVTRDLSSAEVIELVALSPYPPGPPGPIAIGVLESFPILGEAKISSKEEITKLAVSLAAGIRATDGDVKMCFNPRHAIRYEVRGIPVVLIVCFECRQGFILSGQKKIEFLTTIEPEPLWESIFAKYGLPKVE